MTKIRQPNPIFDRALQHSRWPSLKMTLILCGIFSLIGIVYNIAYHFLIQADARRIMIISEYILLIYGLLCLLVAILSAPLSALFTCLHLPGIINSSDFQTIRLTDLPRHSIISGYLLTSVYRLRVLWALTFSMLFILTIILESFHEYIETLRVVTTGGVMGISLNWLAICTGLWASVRWAKKKIALPVTLTIVGGALLLTLGSLWSGDFLLIDWWWFPSFFALTMSIPLSVYLLHQAEQHI